MNRPEGSSPGYTAFARVVRGWHTIQYISKRLREGFLTKDDVDRQVLFDKVQLVEHLTNDNAEAKRRIEELMYGIETKHAITIVSELDCAQTRELQTLFHDLKAMTRIEEIGYSTAHPYEHEAMQAIAGTAMLPLVYVNQKLVGGYDEIKRLEQTKSLVKMLEKAGALAEGVAMDAIQRYPLVVFSKSYCPYCKKAKGLLANLGATPQVFELDLRDDGAAIQDFLFGYTGQATVPNVFIKGKSIGGSDKTAEMHKSGELLARLKSAGAIRG
jgi:glutaredoxin 3